MPSQTDGSISLKGSSHKDASSFTDTVVDSSSDNEWRSSSSGKTNSSDKNSPFPPFPPPSGRHNSSFSTIGLIPAVSMRDVTGGIKPLVDVSIVTKSAVLGEVAQQQLQELTINKLKIQSMEMFGRDKEKAALEHCLTRLMATVGTDYHRVQRRSSSAEGSPSGTLTNSKIRKELVFIQGYSGVGKTRLAQSLQHHSDNNGAAVVVVKGKYDMHSTSSERPYSGIAKAYDAIIRTIKERDMETEFATMITAEFGDEVEELIHLVPELEGLVAFIPYETSNWSADTYDMDHGPQRWKFAFRTLTRLVSRLLVPLVIILDDLQWADSASLDMLQHLVSDVQNPHPLMIIGCYRSNEVKEDSNLAKKIQTLSELQEAYGFHVTDIVLAGCGEKDVNEMIMSMMSMDADPALTKDLAELCYKRTLGNPFFLIEFMKMLHREELVSFNIGLMKWTWDVCKIEAATLSTANVADVVRNRMATLSQDIRRLLQYAACLGPTFRVTTLCVLWRDTMVLQENGDVSEIVRMLLSQAEEEMLIERCKDNMFRWVHDTIQETALGMDGADDTSPLQFMIGTELLCGLDQTMLDNELFSVADLVNKGGSEVKDKAEFASMNLRAARKAQAISAFASASLYVQKGISQLPKDSWRTHPSLTLDLYTIGTQMEFLAGRVDVADGYIAEVLGQKKHLTTMDTLPLKLTKAKSLVWIELEYDMAMKYITALLKQLGCKFLWHKPALPLQALVSFSKMIKKLKKKPVDWYKTLQVTDAKQTAIAELLTLLVNLGYQTGNIFLALICNCELAKQTLKIGVNQYTAVALATLAGFSLILRTDYDTALYVVEICNVVQNFIGEPRKGHSGHIAYWLVMSWATPLQSCLTPFASAFVSSSRMGDVEWAVYSLHAYMLHVPYMLGKPLGKLLIECPRVLQQTEEFGRADLEVAPRVFFQFMANLARPMEERSKEIVQPVYGLDPTTANIACLHLTETEELFFTDLLATADLVLSKGDLVVKGLPGNMLIMIHAFHCGAALYAAARQTKKRKYRAGAQKWHKMIEKWASKGNPNVGHYLLLLDAERAALKNKHNIAKEKYTCAILYSGRMGELHHAGFFNERFADFVMYAYHDVDEAQYRLKEAIRYYDEWGAYEKVAALKRLQESLPSLIPEH
ncbi:MAG: hypothetical protein SGBAC_004320 [Bacillariaceae sp.]